MPCAQSAIRGVIAAASLKPGMVGAALAQRLDAIRGVIAAASLKRVHQLRGVDDPQRPSAA